MLIVEKTATTISAVVKDREGEVLVKKICDSEADALSFLSHLTSTLNEGYREGVRIY